MGLRLNAAHVQQDITSDSLLVIQSVQLDTILIVQPNNVWLAILNVLAALYHLL